MSVNSVRTPGDRLCQGVALPWEGSPHQLQGQLSAKVKSHGEGDPSCLDSQPQLHREVQLMGRPGRGRAGSRAATVLPPCHHQVAPLSQGLGSLCQEGTGDTVQSQHSCQCCV